MTRWKTQLIDCLNSETNKNNQICKNLLEPDKRELNDKANYI